METMPKIGVSDPTGRPNIYTPVLGREICVRISMGESLRKICSYEHMPCKATICNWLLDEEEYSTFCREYRKARKIQFELIVDDIFDIADNSYDDTICSGIKTIPNPTNVARARLRVDARKWAAMKYWPNYVPKQEVYQEVSTNSRRERRRKVFLQKQGA